VQAAAAAGRAAPASSGKQPEEQRPEPVAVQPPVQGMKLEKVEPPVPPPASLAWLFGGALMLLSFGGGALRSLFSSSFNPALRKVSV
jgi:hypothetical protein